ncbi:DUF3713 domain-containing protein [Ureaplasma ceti]|uniref:Uncharacterized protein n=1 Tax=Ureaplasma ceti TaxID=3119530 RepID=A0ABP9U5R1_9BACT
MKSKHKKILWTTFGISAIAAIAIGLGAGLSHRNAQNNAQQTSNPTIQSNGQFTNMYSDNLSPMIASILTSKSGRESTLQTATNNILSSWFKNINNSSLQADYVQWHQDAQKSYNNQYKEYKDKKGSNWQELFQREVLDPVGGTEQAYIQNQIDQNLKSTFISAVFNKNYEGIQTTTDGKTTVLPISQGSSKIVNEAKNINGLHGAGTDNAFTFSAETVPANSVQSVDYGYADFTNFLMNQWVKQTLPLPVIMSLWKNGDKPQDSGLFNQAFFKSAVGTSGSYKFQYFTPSSADAQVLTTTDKFKQLIQGINEGQYVNATTGAITLPNNDTEDSSTIMTIQASSLFNGTIATPFSAAALYKFNNTVFGTVDANMPTASSIDTSSIMKNFLVYSKNGEAPSSDKANSSPATAHATSAVALRNNFAAQPNAQKGVFYFPYQTTFVNQEQGSQTQSVFTGIYKDAVGIKDTVNITGAVTKQDSSDPTKSTSANLNDFILTRDQFGVHLISIDRLSQIQAAVAKISGTTPADEYKKFEAACTEIRNTFMWRAATDIANGTNNYKLQDSLKEFLTNNFNELIIKYAQKALNSQDAYNLFGANVMSGNKPSSSESTNKLGTFGTDLKEYQNILNSIQASTDLGKLMLSSIYLDDSEKALTFVNNVRQQLYANQSSYSSPNPSDWKDYGLAGVLPYTRNSKTGNFDSLTALVNAFVGNFTPKAASKAPVAARNASNANPNQLTAGNDKELVQAPKTTEDLVTNAKVNFENDVVNYINNNTFTQITTTSNGNFTLVGSPTYLITNNVYVNNAIQANNGANQLAPIVQNLYMQRYLIAQNKIGTNQTVIQGSSKGSESNLISLAAADTSATSSSSTSSSQSSAAKGYFYDFSTNSIWQSANASSEVNTAGSNAWIRSKMQEAIDSNYMINNFTSLTNLYDQGDWTSLESTKGSADANGIWKIARQVWLKSWQSSQYMYKNSNGTTFYAYENPTAASNYQKFLITVEYLLDYNASTNTFSFKNLINYLNKVTANNNRAMVAWMNMSSTKGDPSFGLLSTYKSAENTTSVQKQVQTDATFKSLPIYLSKVSPYSWYSAPNYFTSNAATSSNQGNIAAQYKKDVSYTTDSNYWYSAPMTASEKDTTNTGFVGFQANNGSEFGLNNLITNSAFDNSTYATPSFVSDKQTGAENYNYLGTLYQYGSRADLIKAVENISTPNGLMNLYDSVLRNSDLPVSQTSKEKMESLNNAIYKTSSDKVAALSKEIVSIIQDTKQVPDSAFSKMNGMPLWNNNNGTTSTKFAASSSKDSAMVYEYVVTLFNSNDVKALMTNGKLNTTSTGFLGLNPQTFFNAIALLATSNYQLQNDAMNNMVNVIGKMKVYDQRLANSLNSSWIANYEEWQKLKNN